MKTSIDGGNTYGCHPSPEGHAFLPAHPASLRIFQLSNTSDIKDNKNGVTLAELKLKSTEILGAFRKSTYLTRKVPVVVDNEETGEPDLTKEATAALEEVF